MPRTSAVTRNVVPSITPSAATYPPRGAHPHTASAAAAQSARIPYFIRFIMGPAANLAFFAGPRNILPRIYPKKVKNRALRVADRK